MRSKIFKSLLIVSSVFVIFSCEKQDNTLDLEPLGVSVSLLKSDWKITYYFDDVNETADYIGYVLTFQQDGSVVATNGTLSVNGTWFIDDSDSNDDSTDDSVELNIIFSNPDFFEELSDDWDIISFSDDKIELKDISGGDGTTDYLTLEKV